MKAKLHKNAIKFMNKQNPIQRQRIAAAINKLPNGDVKPLRDRRPEHRLRVGSYRIIFEYHDDFVYVLEIDNRGDIY